MELELREHQSDVIDALREGFKKGHRCQLLYAPTGFGKTEVAIYLMKATAEKYNRAAIMMDRLVLVNQTSERLLKYGLRHGVFQADHEFYDPFERLQVCSAQTMESRANFPQTDLLIVDECHVMRRKTINYIKANPQMRVIGLTATPFTKGLGDVYENVVTGATTGSLVEKKWLAPLKVYIAKQIDMTGAKKIAGEWSAAEAEDRGMQITGDIVTEWEKKTHEIFGRPRKTIVFCAGVDHGAQLVEEFALKGYNFVSISYKDSAELKEDAIKDFARPDTEIHGLIATDILTRGFDVPDVMIGVSARPFSKSLSSHIQQMGRVMRTYPGKEFAIWLCLARGSRVLTDCGLIPIEKVTLSHKIWDGTNFVSHRGAICNGIQKVITYQGLTATPRHLVHTAEGWRTFGDCAFQQIRITQTGVGGQAIRLGEDNRPKSFVVGAQAQKVYSRFMRVCDLWVQKCNLSQQSRRRQNEGLSALQSAGTRLSDVVIQPSARDSGEVFGQNPSSLSSLRWPWNPIQIFWSKARGALDHAQPWIAKVFNGLREITNPIGSYRPEWSLRTWESAMAFCGVEPTQQAWKSKRGQDAQIQDGLPRHSIFRQHIEAFILGWNDSRANRGEIQTPFSETEREVWDILDAGPNNRFTCEGLLVHNCHSGNYLRFQDDWDEVFDIGVRKLDDKVEKAKKEPTEREKKESKCPKCGFLWKNADSCPACGHVRERRTLQHVAGELTELVNSATRAQREERQQFYSELLWYASTKNYNPHWAGHKYREKFGVWPKGMYEVQKVPSTPTLKWIKAKQIAWAKGRQKSL